MTNKSMKKRFRTILLVTMVSFVFIACQTKEEKYLSLQKNCIEMLEEIKTGSKYDAAPKVEKCVKIYKYLTLKKTVNLQVSRKVKQMKIIKPS